MIWLRHILWVLLFSVAGFASAAPAGLLQERAFWVDESNTADFQQAIHADYQPYANTLAKGYLNHPVWLRLVVSGVDESQPLVLRLRPPFLKYVTLHDPIAQKLGHTAPQQSGRATPLNSTAFEAIDLGFVIPALPEARDVYLRIDTPTSVIADIQILPIEQALREDRHQILIMLLYVGALLSAATWGLVNFVISRRGLYGLFVLRQAASTVHIVVFTGLYRYLISDHPESAFSIGLYNATICLTIVPIILFDVRLFKEFNVHRFYRNLPLAIASLAMIALALLMLGHTSRALQTSVVISMLGASSLLLPAFMAKSRPGDPFDRVAIWLLRGGFSLTTLIVLMPTLALLLGIDLTNASLNLLIAHAGISTILMMSLLYINSRQREVGFQQMLIEGQVAQTMLAHESRQRIEKENYLAMVTHELRNPLSVIRLLARSKNGSDSIQRAINDMTHIIDRVTQSEKLENSPFAISPTDIDLCALLQELRSQHAENPRVLVHCPEPVSIHSDHNLLLTIVNNLIDNALKYSPPQSPIQVSVAPDLHAQPAGLRICVRNEVGDAGLPDADKLFTKFYRSPGAHRQIGSGLGLYLVRQWITALGGTIDYRNFSDASDHTLIEFALWLPK